MVNCSNTIIYYCHLTSFKGYCNVPAVSANMIKRHTGHQTHRLTVVSLPLPDEARQRYCFASGVWLVQALAHHYITLHNLQATGETSNAASVVSARGGCVTTRPAAKDTGASGQQAAAVIGPIVWYREEAAAAKAAIMTTARTFLEALSGFFFVSLHTFTLNDLTSQGCV